MKTCSKCKQSKPFSEFYPDNTASNIYQRWCKECVSLYKHINKDKRKAYNKRYYQRKYVKLKACQRTKLTRKTNKNKASARNILQQAVREGIVHKPLACSGCLTPLPKHKIQGHHINYNFPLSVVWLCQDCHSQLHPQKDFSQ